MTREKPSSHLHHLRRDYCLQSLDQKDLDANPFTQFIAWLDVAISAEVIEPNAMALATASQDGIPSCRMVLMKHFDEHGLIFYTDNHSRKAKELHQNPMASGVLYWEKLERQMIIEGPVSLVSRKETEAYFSSRPRGSQIGSWASKQDAPLLSREDLEKAYDAIEIKYDGKEIPCPESWTGFRIIPQRFEFWQGRSDRLHDRFCYSISRDRWSITRLSP